MNFARNYTEMHASDRGITQLKVPATDGYPLAVTQFAPQHTDTARGVWVIHSATGVSQRLYQGFAAWMAERGWWVYTYDYRGVAASGPARIPRPYDDRYFAWGTLDAEGVTRYVHGAHPGLPLMMLGHSFGGAALGLMASAGLYCRVVTLGAQTAYYRDWAPAERWGLYWRWHVLQPLVTAVYGYFPGRFSGHQLTDLPAGVIRGWHRRRLYPRLEDHLRAENIPFYPQAYSGPLLCLGAVDDPIGTPAALERLHGYFTQAAITIRWLAPAEFGLASIGHFGFFRRDKAATLWPIVEGNSRLRGHVIVNPSTGSG